MRINYIVFVAVVLINYTAFSQVRGWDWAKSFTGSEFESGNDLAIDDFNNTYIAGNFSDSILIGDSVLSCLLSNNDGFLAKLSSSAKLDYNLKLLRCDIGTTS